MHLKYVSLVVVVRHREHVIRRDIHTLILVRAVLIHQALLAVTELQEQYLRYVVAGRLLVLVINVRLVHQVLIIIAGFTELVTVIVVVMARINLVKKFVGVVGVVIQAHLTIVHTMESVMGIAVPMVHMNLVILVVEVVGVVQVAMMNILDHMIHVIG